MSDEEEDEGPAVPLGEGPTVEGAPHARVASRLHYPIEKSTVLEREGETTIRTPDGPRELAEVLAASEEVYFDTRHAFERAVREVVGVGPVPTEEDGPGDDDPADDDATDDGESPEGKEDEEAENDEEETAGEGEEDGEGEGEEEEGESGEEDEVDEDTEE